jgi:hypothetical protein
LVSTSSSVTKNPEPTELGQRIDTVEGRARAASSLVERATVRAAGAGAAAAVVAAGAGAALRAGTDAIRRQLRTPNAPRATRPSTAATILQGNDRLATSVDWASELATSSAARAW